MQTHVYRNTYTGIRTRTRMNVNAPLVQCRYLTYILIFNLPVSCLWIRPSLFWPDLLNQALLLFVLLVFAYVSCFAAMVVWGFMRCSWLYFYLALSISVKWLVEKAGCFAGKIVSEMIYNVLSGTSSRFSLFSVFLRCIVQCILALCRTARKVRCGDRLTTRLSVRSRHRRKRPSIMGWNRSLPIRSHRVLVRICCMMVHIDCEKLL